MSHTAPATAREQIDRFVAEARAHIRAKKCKHGWHDATIGGLLVALDAAVARALNEMADAIIYGRPDITAMEVYHALRQRALRAPEAGG